MARDPSHRNVRYMSSVTAAPIRSDCAKRSGRAGKCARFEVARGSFNIESTLERGSAFASRLYSLNCKHDFGSSVAVASSLLNSTK